MSKLTDYKPLQRNPNKGTQRGTGILEQSVRELGAGRSILVDKNGVILAGNHAQEAFVNAGIDEVIEVETSGNQVVVVKRTDLDADSSAGKKMAIMDNRTSEQGLAWDAVVVEDLLNEIKQDEGELDLYLNDLDNELTQKENEESLDIQVIGHKHRAWNTIANDTFLSIRTWDTVNKQKEIDYIKERKYTEDPIFAESIADEIYNDLINLFGKNIFGFVTTPPRSSETEYHLASDVSFRVANKLGVNFIKLFDGKNKVNKGILTKRPIPVINRGLLVDIDIDDELVLIIDDIATSGQTIRNATSVLKQVDLAVLPVVWIYGKRVK